MNLKRLYTLLLLAAATNLSYAKDNSRFYVNLSGEYAIPVLGNRGFEDQYIQTYLAPSAGGNPVSLSSTTKKTSFAAGYWINGSIGYCISPNLAFDLGIQIGLSKSKKTYRETLEEFGDLFTSTTHVGNLLLLSPAIKYRYPLGTNFFIHAKAGLALPLGAKFYIEDLAYPNRLTNAEVKTRFSLGFTSGIGGEYRIVKHLWALAEINVTALNLDAKQKTIVSYSEDGQDLLNKIPEEQRTTYYENDVQYNLGFTQGRRNVQQPFEIPLSRLGLRLGLSYYF
ncbi:outer membrane beta-barrel protein [Taibaiella koreensis]|uniref:outer membrane beta-barrel protein n=1 Tax=Taibaiella koreensis TaxID=1268548 RepID=UPI000E59A39B|nr:outer membrane beta-barrel protein [Taibaiella koreensis]